MASSWRPRVSAWALGCPSSPVPGILLRSCAFDARVDCNISLRSVTSWVLRGRVWLHVEYLIGTGNLSMVSAILLRLGGYGNALVTESNGVGVFLRVQRSSTQTFSRLSARTCMWSASPRGDENRDDGPGDIQPANVPHQCITAVPVMLQSEFYLTCSTIADKICDINAYNDWF